MRGVGIGAPSIGVTARLLEIVALDVPLASPLMDAQSYTGGVLYILRRHIRTSLNYRLLFLLRLTLWRSRRDPNLWGIAPVELRIAKWSHGGNTLLPRQLSLQAQPVAQSCDHWLYPDIWALRVCLRGEQLLHQASHLYRLIHFQTPKVKEVNPVYLMEVLMPSSKCEVE
nr:hypothetical protein Iba_scaffold1185775CG0010 [Ipomoea batatas]